MPYRVRLIVTTLDIGDSIRVSDDQFTTPLDITSNGVFFYGNYVDPTVLITLTDNFDATCTRSVLVTEPVRLNANPTIIVTQQCMAVPVVPGDLVMQLSADRPYDILRLTDRVAYSSASTTPATYKQVFAFNPIPPFSLLTSFDITDVENNRNTAAALLHEKDNTLLVGNQLGSDAFQFNVTTQVPNKVDIQVSVGGGDINTNNIQYNAKFNNYLVDLSNGNGLGKINSAFTALDTIIPGKGNFADFAIAGDFLLLAGKGGSVGVASNLRKLSVYTNDDMNFPLIKQSNEKGNDYLYTVPYLDRFAISIFTKNGLDPNPAFVSIDNYIVNPSLVQNAGFLSLQNIPNALCVEGNTLYVTQGYGYAKFDITQSGDNLTFSEVYYAGQLVDPADNMPLNSGTGITVDDNYVYVAHEEIDTIFIYNK